MKKLFAIAFTIVLSAGIGFSQSTQPSPAKTDTATQRTAAFRPTKDQITQGQTMLKEQKLFTGDVTGKYDDATRAAIKSYQKNNGLEENGRFDRATLAKMNIALTDRQSGTVEVKAAAASASKAKTTTSVQAADGSVLKRPAPFRASDEQISAAQKMLRDGKMLEGGDEGKLDDATREALGKYQGANSLKVTKTLNAATLEKMGIALTEKQKEQVAAQAAYDAAKPAKP